MDHELKVEINLPENHLDSDDMEADNASIRFIHGNVYWEVTSKMTAQHSREDWLAMVCANDGWRRLKFDVDCYTVDNPGSSVQICRDGDRIIFSICYGVCSGSMSWSAPVEACRRAFEQVADAIADFEVRRAAYFARAEELST